MAKKKVRKLGRKSGSRPRRRTRILDKRMTKSLEALWNRDREYSAGIDLDKTKSAEKINEITEINRGKGFSETDRPSVKVPRGTDVTVHTHPTRQSNWDRPSGYDIYNMVQRTLNSGDLDESYIIGPNKYWYRYYVLPRSEEEELELWKRIKDLDPREFDAVIETKYKRIHRREMSLAHLDHKQRRNVIEGKAKRSDFPKSKLQKYKQQAIADRRSFHVFANYLESEWSVKLERTRANKKGQMEFHYRPVNYN